MKTDAQTHAFAPVSELAWLFVDLNSYFASVEQQENPALIGKPVAVIPMMTDSTCAIAASYEAKAFGVKTGTKIYDAKRMCPDLHCVLARHDVYVAYHHRIFAELENHLHVTRICSIDEAVCLLLAEERRMENLHGLCRQIKAGLKRNIGPAITCSIGVGPNAFLAKIASDMEKPDGFTVLQPGHYREQLFQLALRDRTGINARMERRLNAAGIHSVEQFWNLSPKHARLIWNSVEGERFWYKLHGYEIPDRQTQKRVVGHSRVLDPQLRPADEAGLMARQLTTKAAARLRRYELYACRLSLGVKTVDGMRWANERSFSPTQDNFPLLKALDILWQRMLCDTHRVNLLQVSVTLHDLHRCEELTLDLFETRTPEPRSAALTAAIDTISQRYGNATISIGACPKTSAGYVGTKIAFTRIPEQLEFQE